MKPVGRRLRRYPLDTRWLVWTVGMMVVTCIHPAVATGSHPDQEQKPGVRGLSVCGPRCVQAILQMHGEHAELSPLVVEMQDSDPQAGCSLTDIQDALDKRGIGTRMLKTGFLEFPSWDQPVVLHYSRGHFVLLCETRGLYAKIRDGVRMAPRWFLLTDVMSRMSGNVLVTGTQALDTEQSAVIVWPRIFVSICLFSTGILGIVFWLRTVGARKSINTSFQQR